MLDETRPLDTCPYCGEPVMPWEPRERYANDPRWRHLECFCRPVLGSVAHIERRCGCFVPGADEGDPPGMTRREAALASVETYRRVSYAAAMAEEGMKKDPDDAAGGARQGHTP